MFIRRHYRWFVVVGAIAALLAATGGGAHAQSEGPTNEELARGINTVWVLLAAFLVFFMQAGFALVESGFTQSKNTINIMMKNIMDFVIATVAFWALGYALMFGEGSPLFGSTGFFLMGLGEDTAGVPTLAFWLFQMVFAGTAATIVSGAMAERTRFVAYLIFSGVITLLIYPIFGHWVWGGGWLSAMETPFMDFAGSTVVHSVGGWAALVGAIFVGARRGRFGPNGEVKVIPGHSMALGTLGVFILWLGWFGFNPGSQLAAIGDNADAIALVAANTNIAAATGALGALIFGWLRTRRPELGLTLNGALGGLVAITAPCAFVSPLASVVIGFIAGPLVIYGMSLLERLKIDDPVGAVPVHLINGIWGTLAVGLFASDSGLLTTGQSAQLLSQLIGVVACGVWTVATTGVLFFTIRATIGLRVSREEEELGLDINEHGGSAYDLAAGGRRAPEGAVVASA